MSRSPILEYAAANPVIAFYETDPGTELSLNEDDSFVLNEDGTNSEANL